MWEAWTYDQQNPDKAPINTKDAEKTKRDFKDMKYFNCQQKGHLAASYLHGAMFCGEQRIDYKGNSAVREVPATSRQGLYTTGRV